ncbi:MAG: hypothetical protein ACRD88_17370 [Terriglobia bacterium]
MTDEQREQLLDRLLESQAHHEESRAHHDAILRRLEESQARHEESYAHHDAFLRRLEELQMTDHLAIGRINNLMAAFAEQHHAALLEIDNRLIRLEALIEAFVRGSRNNGGSKES